MLDHGNWFNQWYKLYFYSYGDELGWYQLGFGGFECGNAEGSADDYLCQSRCAELWYFTDADRNCRFKLDSDLLFLNHQCLHYYQRWRADLSQCWHLHH